MSFIALLLALLLEQARPRSASAGIDKLFIQWADWLRHTLDAGDKRHAWIAWGLAVVLPCALTVLVHWLLWWFGGWFLAMLWSLVVLYATLGFRRFSHHFSGIRDALSTGDDDLARELLRQWQGDLEPNMTRSEIVRHVIEHSSISAHRHVFGVIAWFSVLAAMGLGPAGAVFFRLSALLSTDWAASSDSSQLDAAHSSPALQEVTALAWRQVDWVPARMTGLSFAVVGNFEDAVDAWRQDAQHFPNANDGVVLAATAGAINVRLGGVGLRPASNEALSDDPLVQPTAGREPEVAHLRSMVGLVWRAVVMWMVLLALLTLARLLG
jgi:adenosylcobinamide-phosphate synthase